MSSMFSKFLTAWVLPVAILMFNTSCNSNDTRDVAETVVPIIKDTVRQEVKQVDKALLTGTWERTDAPYQVRISEVFEDGNMKAGYFNPQPINVSKATWVVAGSFLKVYVELQDKNYPGSNYSLMYLPGKDVLTGKYFQAVEGATYEVNFARKK